MTVACGAGPGGCQVLYDPSGWCSLLATVTGIIGCAGERVRERRYCEHHIGEIQAGRVLCTPCGRAHTVQLLQVLQEEKLIENQFSNVQGG